MRPSGLRRHASRLVEQDDELAFAIPEKQALDQPLAWQPLLGSYPKFIGGYPDSFIGSQKRAITAICAEQWHMLIFSDKTLVFSEKNCFTVSTALKISSSPCSGKTAEGFAARRT